MNTKKITEEEIADMKISSLPTRPNAPTSLGGRGYTASDMKAAFDTLPLYIIERLNSLIDELQSPDYTSIASDIKTGICGDDHSLHDLFNDIIDGSIFEYFDYLGTPLGVFLETLRRDVDYIAERLGISLER